MKTIKYLILVIFLVIFLGCENNPISNIETDSREMTFSIKTFDKVDSYLITKLTYDIHDGEKFITWNKEGMVEIYLQNQVKCLEVNGCNSILINKDTYTIDKFIFDIHDGDKFILYLNDEILQILTEVRYLEIN